MSAVRNRINNWLKTQPPGEFKQAFTEEGMNRFLLSGIQNQPGMRNFKVKITPSGLRSHMRMAVGPLEVDAAIKGYLKVDPNRKLYLDVEEIKVGDAKLPEPILRGIEKVFDEVMVSSGGLSVRILDMKYEDGKVQITGERI